jgi:hypothetical protein
MRGGFCELRSVFTGSLSFSLGVRRLLKFTVKLSLKFSRSRQLFSSPPYNSEANSLQGRAGEFRNVASKPSSHAANCPLLIKLLQL